ncbi:hypothetical protein GCM10020254_66090 [Streptomyces goshikiensis]
MILEEGDPGRAKARESKGGALAEGIRWAADHGADVISMSLGDDSESAHHEAAEDEAVQYALAKGVVVVASAGNSGKQGDPVSYPAAYPGVIAVAAVDRRGRKAAFSTRNWYATVSAPRRRRGHRRPRPLLLRGLGHQRRRGLRLRLRSPGQGRPPRAVPGPGQETAGGHRLRHPARRPRRLPGPRDGGSRRRDPGRGGTAPRAAGALARRGRPALLRPRSRARPGPPGAATGSRPWGRPPPGWRCSRWPSYWPGGRGGPGRDRVG